MSPAKSENWPVVVCDGAPDPQLRRDIDALVAAAAESDGNPPLSEQTLVELRGAGDGTADVLTLATYAPEEHSHPATAADLAGVAVVISHGDAGVLEVVVHPTYRNQGVGAQLVDKLKAHRGLQSLTAWSHGNHEAAADLAARYGFASIRELWRMRLVRPAQGHAPLPEPALPAGVTLRAFVPGQDEDAWLAANAAAFAHHPEQGAMTAADLHARMAEPWFDPAGFFLATDTTEAGAGRVLGFHWTKVHPAMGPHPAMGEVYVVGVAPEAQGAGLGKALTIAGITHLQQAGLAAIMLYVDADNAAAVALYKKLGFTRWDADVMYGPIQS
ncbi:mycothiol synthase [Pseudarthrobacter sp. P1]|uniref:mycothiol synthase n=1 Tax=Pseudarthrobacter sp. P1 TaxID=3418418 RepID=UPI003CED153D